MENEIKFQFLLHHRAVVSDTFFKRFLQRINRKGFAVLGDAPFVHFLVRSF